MMAAHAVGLAGRPIVLFGNGGKSRIGGAQFLHKRGIPELTSGDPDFTITYQVNGDAEGYQEKVYGHTPDLLNRPKFVSISNVKDGEQQEAWSMTRVYDTLWNFLGGDVNEATIDAQWIEDNKHQFDLVISTIPRFSICRYVAGLESAPHRFTQQTVHIAQPSDMANWIPDNTIVYDGTKDRSWYRASKIQGITSNEWSDRHGLVLPYQTVAINKPLATNCDCWLDTNVIMAGRYGLWTKGVLAHDGFLAAVKAMQEAGII